MTDYLSIHPRNPQERLVARAAEAIADGAVAVYPTDSAYAFGCALGHQDAQERIRRIRRADRTHVFSLLCQDLSELAAYARVDNPAYRALKAHTPGPYTFILRATREVPRRLQHPKRKTVGLRVPSNPVMQALLHACGEPLLSTTAWIPDAERPLADIDEIREALDGLVDMVIDSGSCGRELTSVVDLCESPPQIVRRGRGDVSAFE
ncbi:MAG: tRNA threonylcarbamoyl adenosine modification protein (Sua5/YciO/YrdC/YwlC family) [Gammaproteobacteria bacterium]|jgi:tRNA threonylcarbamoyl adenosine modification protein (Sua5/YciO/YrdC/YwlC family)